MCKYLRKELFILVSQDSDLIGVLVQGSENIISLWTQIHTFDLDRNPPNNRIMSEIERLRTVQLEFSEPVVVDIGLSAHQRCEASDQECCQDHERCQEAAKFSLLVQRRWQCQSEKNA